jgi:hypothetical protein
LDPTRTRSVQRSTRDDVNLCGGRLLSSTALHNSAGPYALHSLRSEAAVMEMTEKSHKRWAVVIGDSIAGLFVGAFLRRIGWQVELIGRGVGIFATHLELLEALDKCGAGTVDIGVIVY